MTISEALATPICLRMRELACGRFAVEQRAAFLGEWQARYIDDFYGRAMLEMSRIAQTYPGPVHSVCPHCERTIDSGRLTAKGYFCSYFCGDKYAPEGMSDWKVWLTLGAGFLVSALLISMFVMVAGGFLWRN